MDTSCDSNTTTPAATIMYMIDHGYYLSPVPNILIAMMAASIIAQSLQQRRLQWIISIVGCILVFLATLERILLGLDTSNNTTKPEKAYYIQQSLVAWIACVVMDSSHALSLLRVYRGSIMQLFKDFLSGKFLRGGFLKVVETLGLVMSCVSMLNFALNVHTDFHGLTSNIIFHSWFYLACFSKIFRIIVQGLVLAENKSGLMMKKGFVSQIEFSSIFLLMQVLLLAQFNHSSLWLSIVLTSLDVAYRTYQCLVIPYYWCYNPCHKDEENDVSSGDNNRHGDDSHDNDQGCPSHRLANKMKTEMPEIEDVEDSLCYGNKDLNFVPDHKSRRMLQISSNLPKNRELRRIIHFDYNYGLLWNRKLYFDSNPFKLRRMLQIGSNLLKNRELRRIIHLLWNRKLGYFVFNPLLNSRRRIHRVSNRGLKNRASRRKRHYVFNHGVSKKTVRTRKLPSFFAPTRVLHHLPIAPALIPTPESTRQRNTPRNDCQELIRHMSKNCYETIDYSSSIIHFHR